MLQGLQRCLQGSPRQIPSCSLEMNCKQADRSPSGDQLLRVLPTCHSTVVSILDRRRLEDEFFYLLSIFLQLRGLQLGLLVCPYDRYVIYLIEFPSSSAQLLHHHCLEQIYMHLSEGRVKPSASGDTGDLPSAGSKAEKKSPVHRINKANIRHTKST